MHPESTGPGRRISLRRSTGILACLLALAAEAAPHPPPPLALSEADAAIRVDPSDPDLYLRRARLHLELRDLERAAHDVERAAARGADPIEVDLLRARILLDAGAPATALRILERHEDAPPSDPAATRVLLLRAEAASRGGRDQLAATSLEELVERVARPAPDVFLDLAAAWREAGRDDRAAAALRAGVARLGAVPALLATLSAMGPEATPAPPIPASRPRGVRPADPRPDRLPAAAESPSLVRGPYLQRVTGTSAAIRWRTSTACTSRVQYGDGPGTLTQTLDDAALVTEHELVIPGLTPGTEHYYAVGTIDGALEVAQPDQRFRTAPPNDDGTSFRVWVLGDSGTANADAEAVRDAFLAWNDRPLDLWLMLGDNAYPDGTDAAYQAAVFDTYPATLRSAVLWPVLGNHDGLSASSATQSGPWFDVFTLPAAGEAGGVVSGTEAYYSFDWGPVHFVILDSYDSDRSPGGAMLTWLEADLSASDARWTIAAWHHPPYTRGSHDSDSETRLIQMRQNVLPILESHGVALVLAGHSHSYERSVLLDGHYGSSGTLDSSMVLDAGDGDPAGNGEYLRGSSTPRGDYGAVYAVAGSSGKTSSGAPLDHPVMVVATETLGSLVIDVAQDRLDGTFLDDAGGVLDTFRIRADTIFRDGFEDGGTGAWAAP